MKDFVDNEKAKKKGVTKGTGTGKARGRPKK
jgi:hypothetical protein